MRLLSSAHPMALKNLIGEGISKQEEAWLKVQFGNAITVAGRNAMKDANQALKLNYLEPPKTFAQLKIEFSKNGGGDKMYEEISKYVDDLLKKPACFVAGTLVHTNEGLRPIEAIKVGDYVLSKPESGIGELAYKRVTKTFVHENREVFGVRYGIGGGKGALLVTTAEHPFWVPTLRVSDPSVQYGSMTIPHGKWCTPEEIFRARDKYYKSNGKGDLDTYYLSTFDGKEYPVGESAPICTATNNKKSNPYGFAGPEYGVLWSVSRDFQREARGGY